MMLNPHRIAFLCFALLAAFPAPTHGLGGSIEDLSEDPCTVDSDCVNYCFVTDERSVCIDLAPDGVACETAETCQGDCIANSCTGAQDTIDAVNAQLAGNTPSTDPSTDSGTDTTTPTADTTTDTSSDSDSTDSSSSSGGDFCFCAGVGRTCGTALNRASCSGIAGCSWSSTDPTDTFSNDGYCGGIQSGCTSHSTKGACNTAERCTWSCGSGGGGSDSDSDSSDTDNSGSGANVDGSPDTDGNPFTQGTVPAAGRTGVLAAVGGIVVLLAAVV